MTEYQTTLMEKVDAVCQRIAPLWPLENFVAVNPYLGLSDLAFWKAHQTLKRMSGRGLCMPRSYYQEQLLQGRITSDDLMMALQTLDSPWNLPHFEQQLVHENGPSPKTVQLVTDVLGRIDGQDWSSYVVERISRYCAAYFDTAQALWSMPWKDRSLYQGWLEFSRIDKTSRMMGLRGMRRAVTGWPDSAEDAIVLATRILELPWAALDTYLYAALLSVGGWAGWTRYLGWQTDKNEGEKPSIRELLAIRLAWDALFLTLRQNDTLKSEWRSAAAKTPQPLSAADAEDQVEVVLQTAFEAGYQRELAQALLESPGALNAGESPEVQVVFCIDVRSEVYRRALETVSPSTQTLGFAGFFGIPMEYLPFGGTKAERRLPVFFNPAYRIEESLSPQNGEKAAADLARRHTHLRMVSIWKSFKTSASSAFAFVEAAGLWSAPKLISDSMGWTRPVPRPERLGLSARMQGQLGPQLGSLRSGPDGLTGIPQADRPSVAQSILRNMGMLKEFGRLILFVGHASTTSNNPQATGLECGACGGHSGEASARVAAALLNDSETRRGLKQKGIEIPSETFFIAGLHDTTTDEVLLFDGDGVPPSHHVDVAQLRRWLTLASRVTRLERAEFLGIGNASERSVHAHFLKRSRDWAEVRPEWALARNAAFIAAPRTRTLGRNLHGRVFLHEYRWRNDPDLATLGLIMTAPMIVAHWINMQYYGSVVDHDRLGSGNKVLHNVVGGALGVLEGNGGDLRGGLAWQSVHHGTRWIHEPMRLSAYIEAPKSAIEEVIFRNPATKELIDNAWIHLFQIDEDGGIYRRGGDKNWCRYEPPEVK